MFEMGNIDRIDADIVDLLNWLAMAMEKERHRQVLWLAADEIKRLRIKAGVAVDDWRAAEV